MNTKKFKSGDRLVCTNKRPWVLIIDYDEESKGPKFNNEYTFDCYFGEFIYCGRSEWFISVKEIPGLYPEKCFEKLIKQSQFDKILNSIMKVNKKHHDN